ncbi:IS3 family transposase, partial [Mesorhizobium sp. M0644]|uniref:IS3 family transposase n=1 Tax=Mesorhizobium sp. M0644 TaxID=2956979 RepID=UPI003337E5BC
MQSREDRHSLRFSGGSPGPNQHADAFAWAYSHIRDHRPGGVSIAEGCRLMGIARSTYYDQPETAVDDTALVETMGEISDSFEAYGYRGMQAALRQRGIVVNHKKVRRLMREHDLQPRIRRRFIATTDSDHELPIFPNLAKNVTPDGPNQLWVSDITYVTIAAGFVYVAVILDAWSRKVVGYAIGRSIDARLTVAALKAAIERRKPPPGCVHHSDRGSQGGFNRPSQHQGIGGCNDGSPTRFRSVH